MSDTNELRALELQAAERLRTNANAVYSKMSPLLYFADCETLANAYLAEIDTDTDEARPSYWRGNDDGVRRACERITAILDGKDNGSGVCGEPLETLRRRLLAMKEGGS